MYLKGPILVFTAFGMIVSGAILMEREKNADVGPTQIQTVSGSQAECAANGLDTTFGRLGCDTSGAGTTTWSRRTSSGGALFISSDKSD